MAVGGNNGGAGGAKNLAKAAKKPKVTKVTAAKAQEQAYASQGAAVEKAAVQQKRTAAYVKAKQKAGNPAGQLGKVVRTKRLEKKKGGGGGLLATAVNAASTVAPALADVAIGPIGVAGHKAVEAATGAKILPTIHKIAKNTPKDAAELAVTTPSSVAQLGKTAVTDPKKVPGMLAAPYKELAEHPGKFVTEHPVSTALMVQPVVKAPGALAGKALRLAGKQTLERPAATLPGTALKEARTGSKDAVVRAVQARKDAKNPQPVMSEKQIQKRVDEFRDFGQLQRSRVQASAGREAKKRTKGMPKPERREAIRTHLEGAQGGAQKQLDRRFVEEFGATWQRTPEGTIVKPKTPDAKGVLHTDRADADAIAAKVPFDAVVKEYNGKFAVVPKTAAERRAKHAVVGSSKATGAKVMRTTRQAFTGTVLPLSGKWLFGQAAEAGLRGAVAGAGPTSLLREHRVFKALEAQKPGAGKEFRMRTSGGGQFGLTGTAREFANGRNLADEFADTGLARPAKALTKAGGAPGVKHIRAGWHHYSNLVFDGVNGAIERTAQRAMTGKAIKESPLMERHVLGLTDKAIQEAAHGLRATENQVAAGRAVQRMYGQYSKFSPETRSMLLHWTPFLPWYRNVATFLTKTLPVDHPVHAALVADISAAEEEWRKAHGMSLRGGKTRPGFLLGGFPVGKGDQVVRVARYTPFGVGADPAGATADLALPQLMGPVKNLGGVDWKWQPMKHPGFKGREFNIGEKTARAATTAAESMIPGVGLAGRVTGVTGRYVDKKDDPSVLQGKSVTKALAQEYNPLAPTAARPKKPKRGKKGTVKLKLGGTGGKLPLGGASKKLPLR